MALGSIIRSFPAPGSGTVRDLYIDGRILWATEETSRNIYKLDIDTLRIIDTFKGPSTAPTGIFIDKRGIMWLVDRATDTLYNIDVDTGNVIRVLGSIATGSEDSLGITGVGEYIYVVDSVNVLKIFSKDGVLLNSFTLSGFTNVRGIASTGRSLWVTSDTPGVAEVSLDGTKIIRSFAPFNIRPSGVAFDGQSLWHNDYGSDLIYQLSLE